MLDPEKTLRIIQWNCEKAATLAILSHETLDTIDILMLKATSYFNLLRFYLVHCPAMKNNELGRFSGAFCVFYDNQIDDPRPA